MTPSESASQKAVCQWWASYCRTRGMDERLLIAVPNGSVLAGDSRQRAIQMAKLKATGFRVGFPDLMLLRQKMAELVDLTLFHGLMIEMKKRGNKPTKEQAEYHDLLRRAGYNVVVCWSSDEAIRAIRGYLE